MSLSETLPGIPVLAILRGVRADEVSEIADALMEHGIRRIEVPLNSPDPYDAIARLKAHCGDRAVVGAGTVLAPDQVEKLADCGCQLIVSPNFNPQVVAKSKELGMISCPGVFTPTEAFEALAAGADILKYFPAELGGPAAIKAWRAVLPKDTPIVATGGTGATNAKDWISAGANMIGVGGALYKPFDSVEAVSKRAGELAKAFAEN
ncbi:2-dehydro-3-deoxy-6-phosphogalactonate aldolase [uncultured Nitratireductor sp.]|uniref:2-dehydro-3-deoxy-6-phosphogalactonate aldolase n=1 Tax=uncultured Nitratireductor sp. TaxID=520953 RepID=UPI0026155052|nr:2-dehydro-3-deoxy-6-phosphogalactonate aldolase [uncultured Nitratireductor sp.]